MWYNLYRLFNLLETGGEKMGSKNKTNIVSKFELFVAKWLEVFGNIFAIVGLIILIRFLIFYFILWEFQ